MPQAKPSQSFQISPSLFERRLAYHKLAAASKSKNLPNWWTPVWRGLIADRRSKHRRAMGPALWLYLYLLTYANRKNGIVRRKLRVISEDTGYSPRTVQLHLNRLRREKYLSSERSGRYLKIQIEKWKAFNRKGF